MRRPPYHPTDGAPACSRLTPAACPRGTIAQHNVSQLGAPACGLAGRAARSFHWRPSVALLLFSLVILLSGTPLLAAQRFPPPDFTESGHQLPVTTTPPARALWLEYADVAILFILLSAATWIIYKKRSRKAVVALSITSLLYFGFIRYGCICAIGAVQNVALALADPGYAIPFGALAFFVLPLLFALFAGRSFCAGVCPHGAIQDLVLLKPLTVPRWLEHGLSVLPFIYLGAGVLFAATGSAFIICQYDPFVPVFRMSGRTLMVVAGIGLLLLGMFVGRPYCRFLCPLGALLKVGSLFSKFRVRVTPDVCTQCRLCEASCPFGAMREPQAAKTEPALLRGDRRRLVLSAAALPILIAVGAWLGFAFSNVAARVHPTVALADRLIDQREAPPKTGILSPDDLALERARETPDQILAQAIAIRKQFRIGATVFGGWIGLVIAIKLLSLSLHRKRTDYEPDRGDCFSCARCFEYCPNELVRRGIIPALAPPLAPDTPSAINRQLSSK